MLLVNFMSFQRPIHVRVRQIITSAFWRAFKQKQKKKNQLHEQTRKKTPTLSLTQEDFTYVLSFTFTFWCDEMANASTENVVGFPTTGIELPRSHRLTNTNAHRERINRMYTVSAPLYAQLLCCVRRRLRDARRHRTSVAATPVLRTDASSCTRTERALSEQHVTNEPVRCYCCWSGISNIDVSFFTPERYPFMCAEFAGFCRAGCSRRWTPETNWTINLSNIIYTPSNQKHPPTTDQRKIRHLNSSSEQFNTVRRR